MEIKSTKKDKSEIFIKGIVFGKSSVGKTTLAKTLEDVIVLSSENGLLSLADSDIPYIEINSAEDLSAAYSFLYNDTTYKNVIVDSISEIAQQILTIEKATNKDARQAYMVTQEKIVKILKAFRDLPNKNVILLAQEEIEIVDNTYKATPSFPGKKLANESLYLFDFVFRMVAIKNDEGIMDRFLQCQVDEESSAKDRSGKLDFFELPNLGAIIAKIKS